MKGLLARGCRVYLGLDRFPAPRNKALNWRSWVSLAADNEWASQNYVSSPSLKECRAFECQFLTMDFLNIFHTFFTDHCDYLIYTVVDEVFVIFSICYGFQFSWENFFDKSLKTIQIRLIARCESENFSRCNSDSFIHEKISSSSEIEFTRTIPIYLRRK